MDHTLCFAMKLAIRMQILFSHGKWVQSIESIDGATDLQRDEYHGKNSTPHDLLDQQM